MKKEYTAAIGKTLAILNSKAAALDIEAAKLSDTYAAAWHAGNSDRPTLDELLPIDAAKEATSWWT
ncbi:hypothetical protein [Thalassoroseus pseudoceratinae]|uniref:hypothetical protein n=1 Tax=Thalassoroseus pseudoceratinae TaxID=2713176 RepID=UPI00141F157E|nr:hypothetical protein [Thalassoroseus pseudoceratinae]